jgi:hypothetical protein
VSPRAATTRRGRDEGLAKSGRDPSLPWVRRQADKTPNASRPMDCHQREVMVLSEFPLYEGLGSVKADALAKLVAHVFPPASTFVRFARSFEQAAKNLRLARR